MEIKPFQKKMIIDPEEYLLILNRSKMLSPQRFFQLLGDKSERLESLQDMLYFDPFTELLFTPIYHHFTSSETKKETQYWILECYKPKICP